MGRKGRAVAALVFLSCACGPPTGPGPRAGEGPENEAPRILPNVLVQTPRFTRPGPDSGPPVWAPALSGAGAEDAEIVVGTIDEMLRVERPCETVVAIRVVEEVVLRAEEVQRVHGYILSFPRPATPKSGGPPPEGAGSGGAACEPGTAPLWSAEVPDTLSVGQRLVWVAGARRRLELRGDPVLPAGVAGREVTGLHSIDEIPALVKARGPLVGDVPLAPWPDSATPRCLGAAGEVVPCPAPLDQDGNRVTRAPNVRAVGASVLDDTSGLEWQKGHSPAELGRVSARRYCEDLTLSGYSDWRLPRYHELEGILDHGRSGPALVAPFDGPKEGILWTATLDAGVPWVMTVEDGTLHSTHYDDPGPHGRYLARCVRSASGAALRAGLPVHRYLKRGSVIEDPLLGVAFAPALSESPLLWKDAAARCSALRVDGAGGFRLPTLREVLSLTPWLETEEEPPMCRDGGHIAWPDTTNDLVWTSTPSPAPDGGGSVFVVNGFCGAGHWPEATTEPGFDGAVPRHHALCVRDLPRAAPPAGAAAPADSPGAVRDGAVVVRYPSGHPFAEGAYRDGKRQGEWRYHHDQGPVWLRITYEGGLAQGEERVFYDSGAPLRTGRFVAGLPEGRVDELDPEGRVRRSVEYRKGLQEGTVSTMEGGAVVATETSAAGAWNGPRALVDEQGSATISYVGGVAHGPAEGTHAGGAKRFRGAHENGLASGAWTFFHPNGRVAEEKTYVAGELEGQVRAFFEDGKPSRVEGFLHGKRHGEQRAFHPDGSRAEEGLFEKGTGSLNVYSVTGALAREHRYRDERQHGTVTWYHPNGKKQSETTFEDGLFHGASRDWNDKGVLVREAHYQRGRKHGVERDWHDSGVLRGETTYERGRPVGPFKRWDETGALREEGTYEDGLLHGVVRFHVRGKLAIESTYTKGVEVKDPVFFP